VGATLHPLACHTNLLIDRIEAISTATIILFSKPWNASADADHHIDVVETVRPELAAEIEGTPRVHDILYEVRLSTPTTIQNTTK
jgi:hypothetical protein